VVPNCVAKPKGDKRSYVCDEIHGVKDISSLNLRRPIDRGYVVNWDLQKDIWDHVFKKVLKIKPKECHLVLTEAPFNLPAIMAEQDDVIFDHFGFKSALICNPASLVLANHFARHPDGLDARARCGVVLDAGFSFAHATPIFDARVMRKGVRRVNLGGKALTNYLKELVSYRQWNMMDEYVLMDDVKVGAARGGGDPGGTRGGQTALSRVCGTKPKTKPRELCGTYTNASGARPQAECAARSVSGGA